MEKRPAEAYPGVPEPHRNRADRGKEACHGDLGGAEFVIPEPDDHGREPVNEDYTGARSEGRGDIGRQPPCSHRLEHHSPQRQGERGEEPGQARAGEAMEEKGKDGEQGGEQHPGDVNERGLQTGQRKPAPVCDQAGKESEDHHPQKPAPGPLRTDEPLFDEKWQHYCDQILKGTTDGAIKGVRALLVLGEGVSEQDLVVRTLAGFYEATKGHDYRVIEESIYGVQKSDNRIDVRYIDFGMY